MSHWWFLRRFTLTVDQFVKSQETWPLPRIALVPVGDWMADKTMHECMAWYHPWSNTIFFREDCFTFRVMLHEMGHWFLFISCLDYLAGGKLQRWWDRKCFFAWHMAKVAYRVGVMKKEDFTCKKKPGACKEIEV